ncbi:MAG: DUF2934 domain-containing protein [Candidatus Omnitrophota bacterium]
MVKKEAKKTVKKTMKRSGVKNVAPKRSSSKSTFFKDLSEEELYNLTCSKAYELYLQRGAGHGDDHSDWYKAECFVRSKYKK